MKGKITKHLTVWCATCEEWDYLDSTTLRFAYREAKEYGWIFTKKYGWLCPDCVRKLPPRRSR